MNKELFLEWIKKNDPDCIYTDQDTGLIIITQEWLCGTFAGRGFEGKTEDEAWEKLEEYLNNHIGHNSWVGNIVTDSGWPDYDRVIKYLESD